MLNLWNKHSVFVPIAAIFILKRNLIGADFNRRLVSSVGGASVCCHSANGLKYVATHFQYISQRVFNAFSTYLLCRVFASRVTIFTFGWMKNSFSWGKRLISRGGPQLITCFRTELRFTWIFSIKNAGLFLRYKYATSQFSRTISTVLINISLLS